MIKFELFKHRLKLVWTYSLGLVGLRASDIWLAWFPRSGNTWIRFVLCNYLSLAEMGGVPVDFHLLDATMPALGFSRLTRPWPFTSLPRFVKTHRPFTSWLLSRPRRVVYVLRDPRDVMVSYFHFAQKNRALATEGDFSAFIRHERFGLEAYLRHHGSWKPRITALVRYEALCQDPSAELSEMFARLGVPVDAAMLAEAIDRASLSAIRAAQAESGISGPARFEQGFQFARKGRVGQWQDYFAAQDLDYFQALTARYGFDAYPAEAAA